MTNGYKPEEDKRWRGKDHPYWNARCVCTHPRREHEHGCMMAGCGDCKRFRLEPLAAESGSPLPHSYA